ncbi:MAG: RNA methyltransferase [Pseudomonadota bacterium]
MAKAKKPPHIVAKERARRADGDGTVWLFGLHAVEAALANPTRKLRRLIVTPNAAARIGPAIEAAEVTVESADPRRFPAPLPPQVVHQGVALETVALAQPSVSEVVAAAEGAPARLLLLDRVTDPQNAGAILRSAAVFGARAVIAPARHSAPETGALAKAASGALEVVPYLRVPNLARAMGALAEMGVTLVGLDGGAEEDLAAAAQDLRTVPAAIVLGAEGAGLRALTRESCQRIVAIEGTDSFGSLNVSNAAAISLFAFRP